MRNYPNLKDIYESGLGACIAEIASKSDAIKKAPKKVQKYRRQLEGKLSPMERCEIREKLDLNTALIKIDIFYRDALKPGNRIGKYKKLSNREITTLAATLLHIRFQMRTISTTEDFLRLAYMLFHSPSAGYKIVGKGIASKREFFEKKKLSRGVIAGHGVYHLEVAPITVPKGKTIHFYCGLGSTVKDTYANTVEGYTATGALPEPHESWGEGTRVENHFLGFPKGLNINLAGRGKYNVITNKSKVRWVPLSILLKDPLCKMATDIHWCACRQRIAKELYPRFKLRGSYLYDLKP
jgi:hypothetical protein